MSSPAKNARAVQRARDLTGAAADPVDELALRDHRRDLVAVRFVSRPDHLVEVEDLAGHEHVAVELRGREPEVERARLVLLVACVAGLEPADHLTELQIGDLRAVRPPARSR